MKFVKYYFPDYKLPEQGDYFHRTHGCFFSNTSFGTQGDIKSNNILGIGLQLHLGANSSYYQNDLGLELYPTYISKNFDREHIPVNCMKLIIDELYPESPAKQALTGTDGGKGEEALPVG